MLLRDDERADKIARVLLPMYKTKLETFFVNFLSLSHSKMLLCLQELNAAEKKIKRLLWFVTDFM